VHSNVSQCLWYSTQMCDFNLVNETNLVHDLFLVYLVNIISNLYVFRTSPGPSLGGRTVFYVTLGT
jgi:hypothetical protein